MEESQFFWNVGTLIKGVWHEILQLWMRRNNRIYKQQSQPLAHIVGRIKEEIGMKLVGLQKVADDDNKY